MVDLILQVSPRDLKIVSQKIIEQMSNKTVKDSIAEVQIIT